MKAILWLDLLRDSLQSMQTHSLITTSRKEFGEREADFFLKKGILHQIRASKFTNDTHLSD